MKPKPHPQWVRSLRVSLLNVGPQGSPGSQISGRNVGPHERIFIEEEGSGVRNETTHRAWGQEFFIVLAGKW